MAETAMVWAVTTPVLLLYFLAIDALVGGTVLLINARVRTTAHHRELSARLARALPLAGIAAAALGCALLVLLRGTHGPDLHGVLMLPTIDGSAAGIPRLLHLALAACAVTGVMVARIARRCGPADASFRAWLVRHGATWAMFCTLANLLVGVLWMAGLPHETAIRFTGADTHVMVTFAWALVAAILALGFIAMSFTVADPRHYLDAGSIALLVTLVGMVRMREALRPAAETMPPSAATLGLTVALAAAGTFALARAARAFARTR